MCNKVKPPQRCRICERTIGWRRPNLSNLCHNCYILRKRMKIKEKRKSLNNPKFINKRGKKKNG